MAATGDAVKAGEKVVGRITRKGAREGAREQDMSRQQYRESYGEQKGFFGKASDALDSFNQKRDAKTRKKYGSFHDHDEAAKMRAEMRSAKLRPLKAFAGTKFGKILMAGAGIYMFMNGGLALPLAAMGHMMNGLIGGGLAYGLLHKAENGIPHPLRDANAAVAQGNKNLAEGNKEMEAKGQSPFQNSAKVLEGTQAQAAKNTQEATNGPSEDDVKKAEKLDNGLDGPE